MKVVKDHWYRADAAGLPCKMFGCGRSQEEHVESVGEWMTGSHHLFRPNLRRPSFCARCDRRWGHSTHLGSRRNRHLHWDRWNYFWGYFRHPKCKHRSHRLRLPCLRTEHNEGLCKQHFECCWEGWKLLNLENWQRG